MTDPLSGAWYRETGMRSYVLGATTRSVQAFFLIPFLCIWSGGSLGGIYGHQIRQGRFNLFFSLFGLPFLAGTIFFGSYALMMAAGKVEIRADETGGVIFTGIGPIGRRRRFLWHDVLTIRRTVGLGGVGGRGSTYSQISFVGDKTLNFARGVRGDRLEFMMAVLQQKWRELGRK